MKSSPSNAGAGKGYQAASSAQPSPMTYQAGAYRPDKSASPQTSTPPSDWTRYIDSRLKQFGTR